MPVPGLPDVEMSEAHPTLDRHGQPQHNFISQYFRELPYGWDVLAENLQDPCECITCYSMSSNSSLSQCSSLVTISASKSVLQAHHKM